MQQNFEELNKFNPKQLIDKRSLEMKPENDQDGNLIPSFSEFISKKITKYDQLNEEEIKLLDEVYHSQVYNKPRPESEPFEQYISMLEEQISDAKEEESKIDLSKLEKLSDTTYFDSSKGNFIDLENRISDFYNKKLEMFLDLRNKYSI